MEKTIKSSSIKQTNQIACDFAKHLNPKNIIGLVGDLGAGKTCFVKGVAGGLGCEDLTLVNSPTFTIVNEYKTKKNLLFHFDLYRLHNISAFDTIGFYDYVDRGGIILIEWINNVDHVERDLDVVIEIINENERQFKFVSCSKEGEKILTRL